MEALLCYCSNYTVSDIERDRPGNPFFPFRRCCTGFHDEEHRFGVLLDSLKDLF